MAGVLKHRKDSNNSDVTGPSDYQRRGVLPDAIPPPFGATPGMLSDGDPKKLTSDIVLETPASQVSTITINTLKKINCSLSS